MKCSLSSGIKFVIGVLVLATAAIQTRATIPCASAITELSPCRPYLLGPAANPLPQCCQAADDLNKKANTKEDRQGLCECFKQAAKSLNVNVTKAQALPKICHVNVPAPIDPNIDCSTIPLMMDAAYVQETQGMLHN